MHKLLQFLDEKLLKFGVAFALIFTAIYPKLPSIQITHTWVYVRLEDFLIAALLLLWILQVIRRKVSLPWPLSLPIFLYWVAGLCSLIFSLIFIGPHIANFFPKIAALSYVRRIEYLALFFIAFSTIKSSKDIKDYFVILCVTVSGIVLYGLGQRYYLNIWSLFPQFFEKYPFCFPSFQTGNEEFAKGIPLCLPSDARITSTFGGHYDLAAYLVVVIPVLFAGLFTLKKKWTQIYVGILSVLSVLLLIFTASRISFIAYIVGVAFTFILFKKKKFIVPILLLSMFLLVMFSGSTAKRFLETIRFTNVVTNSSGQVIGVAANTLPKDLQNKISKNPIEVAAAPPTQNLPAGSSFVTLPQGNAPTKTREAVVQSGLSSQKAKYIYGGVEISKVSGNFLVQKALVYDISFTTRFQGEWPHAWMAFVTNPLFGAGYSTITLATDNDYLRFLGESGIFGLLSFMLIFMFLAILLKESVQKIESSLGQAIVYGLAGGAVGLFINASLIDVFEASKVAEPLWILLGLGAGITLLYNKVKIDYKKNLISIFTSPIFIFIYLFIILGIVFFGSLNNFFVGDDFTWLYWAASSNLHSLFEYFVKANGFFYRPIDKLVIFFLNTFFAFQPSGYRLFELIVHLVIAFGVYRFGRILFNKKMLAFIAALIFLVLPAHAENVYWISTISVNLSTAFIVYSLISWADFRNNNSQLSYFVSIIFSFFALLSYEMSVILPLLIFITDVFIIRPKRKITKCFEYIPLFISVGIYALLRLNSHAVSTGGDYSYNVYHFIPNLFGNLFGYFALFIFGEYSLPFYAQLRDMTKIYALPMLIVFALAGFAILFYFVRNRQLFASSKYHLFTYGIVFFIVALLPFIGLGNIAERYLYLGSIGLIISSIVIINSIWQYLKTKNISLAYGLTGTIVSVIICWMSISTFVESQQWKEAGDITGQTLFTFRTKYEDLKKTDTVYINNLPIRKANAWIFPVGLSDGLWFIYREDTPKVVFVKSINEAKVLKKANKGNSYIFSFDKLDNFSQVQ